MKAYSSDISYGTYKIELDIVSDMIFLCQIYHKNLRVLYYNKHFSIKTQQFAINPNYEFIDLSLLTPGKIETFYTKEFISKAAMCQGLLYDVIDKMFKSTYDIGKFSINKFFKKPYLVILSLFKYR